MIVRSLALTSLIALAVPACATPPASQSTTAAPASFAGIDLGPSSRVPRTQLAMAGSGHEAVHFGARPPPEVQAVHDDPSSPRATGTVNAVDPAGRKINVSHQPIPAIGWPAMTMEFAVAPSVDLSRVKAGSRINFSIEKGQSGMYQIETIQPAAQ
ncbi:MAG TPA: copper-binding protein [Acetobacteraceae bacterium]|jgi:Cu(I)/Ag(I) efflux system protein CusF|nr:copper-binding protein [Acetobacteraceae bacterium]